MIEFNEREYIDSLGDLSNVAVDRVRICIDVMQRVVDRSLPFNLLNWREDDRDYEDMEDEPKSFEELESCGSSACLGGWLAVSKEFNDLGGEVNIGGQPLYNGRTGFGAIDIFTSIVKVRSYGHSPVEALSDPESDVWTEHFSRGVKITAKDVLDRLKVLHRESAKFQESE
jgi:hypothetical protein